MSKKQTIAAAMSAAMIFTGTLPAAASTLDSSEPDTDATSPAAEQDENIYAQIEDAIKADMVEGTFSWDQNSITPNSEIQKVFANASSTLCGAHSQSYDVSAEDWTITVSGDVANEYTATVDSLAKESSEEQTMTCTCGGNPADGRATITAKVTGLSVNYLVKRAAAQTGVNTITFTSADGTQVSMPLAYVVGHHGVVSFEINDEDLSQSVGGFNQLWIKGTSANYFVRDITAISVTKEDEVPPNPGETMEYPNSPNVGLLSATEE